MPKTLDLSRIGWPPDYIRKEPDLAHVEDLRDVVKQAKKGEYPFDDPIVVIELGKPVKAGMTMAGAPGDVDYWLAKGLHRCLALQLQKVKTVSADIKTFSAAAVENGDALFLQYDAHSVLKLTIAERAAFIKRLRSAPYKWPVEKVAEKMNISTASVSRIARDLQGGGKKGRSGPRKKKATIAAAEPVEQQGFDAVEWYSILAELVSTAANDEHRKAILEFAKSSNPATIKAAMDVLTEITETRVIHNAVNP